MMRIDSIVWGKRKKEQEQEKTAKTNIEAFTLVLQSPQSNQIGSKPNVNIFMLSLKNNNYNSDLLHHQNTNI